MNFSAAAQAAQAVASMQNMRTDMQAGPSGMRPVGAMAPNSAMGMMGSPQEQQMMMQQQQMMGGAGMGGGTTYTGPYPWKQGVCECTQSGDICMEGMCCLPCLYGSTVSKVRSVSLLLSLSLSLSSHIRSKK